VSSFAEVRIVAERLEFREFGPQDAAAVKALVEAGDHTSLPPGAPSQLPEVDAWLADGVHRHRREGGGVHLMMLERSSGELAGSISLFKTGWAARSSEVGDRRHGDRPDDHGACAAEDGGGQPTAPESKMSVSSDRWHAARFCVISGLRSRQ
jgi:RimJ/RimL family protein N-acetyltransferase